MMDRSNPTTAAPYRAGKRYVPGDRAVLYGVLRVAVRGVGGKLIWRKVKAESVRSSGYQTRDVTASR